MATVLDKANEVKSQKEKYIIPENLRAGVTALGVTGTYKGLDTSDADATAGDIIQGKTAYVNGEKITGTYDGGTIESNIDLNVFLQEQEPERKDGIWIRDGETAVSGTKFLYHDALQDEFLDNRDVRFLRNDINCMGQIIVGDYLYTFGKNSGESRKFNLKTREVTVLNVPNIITTSYQIGSTTGACYYEGKIYIFYYSSETYKLRVLCYNPVTDSSSNWEVGTLSDSNFLNWFSNINIYNGVAYFLGGYSGSGSSSCRGYAFSYNFKTRGYTQTNLGGNTGSYWGYDYFNNITGNRNEFIYFVSRGVLYKFDITNRSTTTVMSLTNYITLDTNCGLYCTDEYIYLFVLDSNKFYKIKFLDNSVTTHNIGFNLQIKSARNYGSSATTNVNSGDSILFDDLSGKLYFRTSNAYYKGNVSCMQLYSEEHLGSNKLVVQLSNSYPFVKLENTTELYSGFKDTYLIKDNVISSDHMMCYGDGENWNIFKNPHNDTCTVSFDLDGGTGEIESQTFVCGGRATEPAEIPEKTDYTFDGWLLNNEIFDFSRIILSNTTLKARWVSTIVVTFDDDQGNTSVQYVLEGHTATIPERPSKPDDQHKFYRWTLNGEPFDFNTPITEPITLVAEYIEASDIGPLTQSNFENDGDFYNVTPTYLTNQVDGTDGFRITGTNSQSSGTLEPVKFRYHHRWVYKLDLSLIDQIDFYAEKVNNHGLAKICITPEYDSYDGYVLNKQVHYSNLPTTYTHYAVDVSNITGEYYVHFIGGYTDSTGSSDSATDFCNIKFLAETDFTDRIVL